jgi:hypothetical protein
MNSLKFAKIINDQKMVCFNKQTYFTFDGAKEVADTLKHRVYHCTICHHYHLTSTKQNPTKKIKDIISRDDRSIILFSLINKYNESQTEYLLYFENLYKYVLVEGYKILSIKDFSNKYANNYFCKNTNFRGKANTILKAHSKKQ